MLPCSYIGRCVLPHMSQRMAGSIGLTTRRRRQIALGLLFGWAVFWITAASQPCCFALKSTPTDHSSPVSASHDGHLASHGTRGVIDHGNSDGPTVPCPHLTACELAGAEPLPVLDKLPIALFAAAIFLVTPLILQLSSHSWQPRLFRTTVPPFLPYLQYQRLLI